MKARRWIPVGWLLVTATPVVAYGADPHDMAAAAPTATTTGEMSDGSMPATGMHGPMMHGMADAMSVKDRRIDTLIAAVLSLQPFPADLGNIYVGNWRFGLVSTGVQLSLMTVGMILVVDNAGAMHAWGYDTRDTWTQRERNAMYAIVSGYVLTKLVSASVAVATAAPPRHQAWIVPDIGPQRAGLRLTVAVR